MKFRRLEGLDRVKAMSYMSDESCTRCGHARVMHIAGQCSWVGDFGLMSGHFCGMSYLGKGNAWGLPAGWHSASEMREAARGMENPPRLIPFGV